MVTLLGLLLIFISVPCFALILVHAFQRSVGTGFLVLLLPIYNVYYGFSQFEHRHKGLILAAWLGCFVPGVILRFVGLVLAARG